MAENLIWRVYQGFFMGDKLGEYESLLASIASNGYRVLSLSDWMSLQTDKQRESRDPLLVLRHDIDSDPLSALRMARLEKKLGFSSSYFFRLKTFDASVVGAIRDMGFHVDYHYEEIAAFAKEHRIYQADKLVAQMPLIAERFVRNVERLRERYRLPINFPCSHGDWMNRALGVPNWKLLQLPEVRVRAGIRFEAYDQQVLGGFLHTFADQGRPALWRPDNPFDHLARQHGPVHVLIHPSQWASSVRYNFPDVIERVVEGAVYRFQRRKLVHK